jgi:uncharacterized short protein YbdD (DUF466 family)
MLNAVKTLWGTVRRLSGDDAYEQYLKHYAETHVSTDENSELVPPLLTREEFFKQWQDNKWKGVKRCC